MGLGEGKQEDEEDDVVVGGGGPVLGSCSLVGAGGSTPESGLPAGSAGPQGTPRCKGTGWCRQEPNTLQRK